MSHGLLLRLITDNVLQVGCSQSPDTWWLTRLLRLRRAATAERQSSMQAPGQGSLAEYSGSASVPIPALFTD